MEIDQYPICLASLNSWVLLICARYPANLEVSFDFYLNGLQFIPLPPCIFETQSLVKIELRGYFNCKLPESGIVSLPNLKELSLNGLDFDFQVLRTLFKSCPLLEILFLGVEFMEDEIVEISAPNLRKLAVYMRGSSYRSIFLIDAPLLEEIDVQDCVAFYYFVKIPSNLQKARIHFWDSIFGEGSVHQTHIPELIRGISNVNSIQLGNNIHIFDTLNRMDAANLWSLFHNLTYLCLSVSKECVNWGARIPLYLLSKLKRIDVLAIKGDDNDVCSVYYILSLADVLEQLNISCFANSGKGGKRQLWKEYKFCGKLFTFSRRSITSKIEFNGAYIHAFSHGPRNASSASQIDWLGPSMWPDIEEEDE